MLYSDDLHIPARALDGQCGNCGATLNEYGQCERCIEDAEQARLRDAEADESAPWAPKQEPDDRPARVSQPAPRPFDPALIFHWWTHDRHICALILMALESAQLEATAAAFAAYLNERAAGSICGAGLRAETALSAWQREIAAASPPILAAA